MKFCLSAGDNNDCLIKRIEQHLSKNGAIVFRRLYSAEQTFVSFDRLDGLIVLATTNNDESGYLSALAIAQKKPILYLLPVGSILPKEISLLQTNEQVKRLLLIKYYSEYNLESRLAEFVDLIERGCGDWEMPTIKFTWRISPKIERYLKWKTINTNKTKADWLLSFIIQEIIEKDQEYHNFLHHS